MSVKKKQFNDYRVKTIKEAVDIALDLIKEYE